MTLAEAQAKLPDLIHHLTTGEGLFITDGGQIVARLVGEKKTPWQRPGPGLGKGMITIVADDDEHLKDFAEYMA